MGLLSRVKGKVFERKVAALFRARFPDVAPLVKRTIQSRGAIGHGADVQFPGLWIEAQDSRCPDPRAKLEQAYADKFDHEIPVAITHRTGTRSIQVTMHLRHAAELVGESSVGWPSHNVVVTMDLEDFFALYEASPQWAKTKPRTARRIRRPA